MKKFLSLVLTLFVSSFVFAAPPKENKKSMPPTSPNNYQLQMKQDFDKISKELNITDEQKQKINELMQADLSKKKELRQQIKQTMNIIDEELTKENLDTETINKLTHEIQQLSAEISKLNVESKLNVRNILSFKQYSRMEQARMQMMDKFKQINRSGSGQEKGPQKNKK
jgi:Spy/CpxP family protein refolding chaperone